VRKLLKAGWPDGVVLNVNFPDCEPEAVKGFVATMQGQRDPDLLRIEDRHDTLWQGLVLGWHRAAARQTTKGD
jgi:5'/3'-nucleotidase